MQLFFCFKAWHKNLEQLKLCLWLIVLYPYFHAVADVGRIWRWSYAESAWIWLRALEAARTASHAPQSRRVRPNVPGPCSVRRRRQLHRLGRHGWSSMGRTNYRSSRDPRPSAQIRCWISQQCWQPWCDGSIETFSILHSLVTVTGFKNLTWSQSVFCKILYFCNQFRVWKLHEFCSSFFAIVVKMPLLLKYKLSKAVIWWLKPNNRHVCTGFCLLQKHLLLTNTLQKILFWFNLFFLVW